MEKIIKKITASILSFIVLFSSMSFAIDEHICGDQVMDVSYFGNADNCGMEEVKINSNNSVLKGNNCCLDQITLFQSSLFNIEKPTNLHNLELQFLSWNSSLYVGFHIITSFKLEYYKDFSPPDINNDFQVLHQVFLI